MPKRVEKRASYVWHPSKELYKKIRELAKREGLSINQLINKLLATFVKGGP